MLKFLRPLYETYMWDTFNTCNSVTFTNTHISFHTDISEDMHLKKMQNGANRFLQNSKRKYLRKEVGYLTIQTIDPAFLSRAVLRATRSIDSSTAEGLKCQSTVIERLRLFRDSAQGAITWFVAVIRARGTADKRAVQFAANGINLDPRGTYVRVVRATHWACRTQHLARGYLDTHRRPLSCSHESYAPRRLCAKRQCCTRLQVFCRRFHESVSPVDESRKKMSHGNEAGERLLTLVSGGRFPRNRRAKLLI